MPPSRSKKASPSLIPLLLAFLFLLTAATGCWQKNEPESPPPAITTPETPAPVESHFVFEEPDLPLPEQDQKKEPVEPSDDLPRIAIIIDDMGHHGDIGRQLLDLDLNLTFSFLPAAPFTEELNAAALEKNRDVLVHLPMEAQDPKWDPGPDALYLSTPLEAIGPITDRNIGAIRGAIGVNNHMGSRYTESRPFMHKMLKALKEKNLFFIDSYTTVNSVAMDEARKMGIKTARRHVFLDNIHKEEDICKQLERLIEAARKQGWAIGIGHPNKETLLALTRCREDLFRQVRLVGVHELVE